ncbi:hypothetical protein [Flagellimonas marinaquae]|uniref:hypothetical protein n=1 Tax=Flagellimonas marinaquae TaxID=254955 RepID=UPI00207613CD|nr:hypothetical protein [Allomuricauda aquimarina]USD24757.1 hypothetical protein MJO53_13845 [Allomuricauda aquimarina]
MSDKNFSFGEMIVTNTKKQLESDNYKFNAADYLNITTALYALNEKKETWEISLKKMSESEKGCEYLTAYKKDVNFYKDSKELYDSLIKNCGALPKEDSKFDFSDYVNKNQLNIKLVSTIKKIGEDDQKYRKLRDMEKQYPLDIQNQILIDSLFQVNQTYIGKSLVGDKYDAVMWAVIQHSNLEMMERYLPVVQNAVDENELNQTPFKMLIDRIYSFKYGYQIFGSQVGVDLADKKEQMEVAKKYGIE